MISALQQGGNCKQTIGAYIPPHAKYVAALAYLWNIEVQTCDKLQTPCSMKRNILFGRQRYYQVYNSCSKCLPFARTHARRRLRHSLNIIALSCMTGLISRSLEMFAFCLYKRSKTLTALVNCIVNDALLHGVPNIQQTVLQFVNAVRLRLMHLLLDVTPYLVIDRPD